MFTVSKRDNLNYLEANIPAGNYMFTVSKRNNFTGK